MIAGPTATKAVEITSPLVHTLPMSLKNLLYGIERIENAPIGLLLVFLNLDNCTWFFSFFLGLTV